MPVQECVVPGHDSLGVDKNVDWAFRGGDKMQHRQGVGKLRVLDKTMNAGRVVKAAFGAAVNPVGTRANKGMA